MSQKIAAQVMRRAPHQPLTQLVLIVLAMSADRDGFVSMPISRIQAETGMSADSVCRSTRRLCDSGDLEIIKRGGGRGVVNRYRITLSG